MRSVPACAPESFLELNKTIGFVLFCFYLKMGKKKKTGGNEGVKSWRYDAQMLCLISKDM